MQKAMQRELKSPNRLSGLEQKEFIDVPRVFLAGGITGCPDWQRNVYGILQGCIPETPFVLYNPRQDDFDVSNPSASHDQIVWEREHLNDANMVLFWFPAGESVCPIALFELGVELSKRKGSIHPDLPYKDQYPTLIVGAEEEEGHWKGIAPSYPRINDLREQLPLFGYLRDPGYSNLDYFCRDVAMVVSDLHFCLKDLPQ